VGGAVSISTSPEDMFYISQWAHRMCMEPSIQARIRFEGGSGLKSRRQLLNSITRND